MWSKWLSTLQRHSVTSGPFSKWDQVYIRNGFKTQPSVDRRFRPVPPGSYCSKQWQPPGTGRNRWSTGGWVLKPPLSVYCLDEVDELSISRQLVQLMVRVRNHGYGAYPISLYHRNSHFCASALSWHIANAAYLVKPFCRTLKHCPLDGWYTLCINNKRKKTKQFLV